jgi:hypothetical protein
MLYTVSIKTLCGRSYYRGHFTGDDAAAVIAKVFRFLGNSPENFTATAKPYVKRGKWLGVAVRDDDAKASAGDGGPCVPLALAAVSGLPYVDTNAALELVGARGCRSGGTRVSRLPAACDLLGLVATDKMIVFRSDRFTFRKLAASPEFASGKFIVCSINHAVALVDGKYIDNADSSDLARVASVWMIQAKENLRKLLTSDVASATL